MSQQMPGYYPGPAPKKKGGLAAIIALSVIIVAAVAVSVIVMINRHQKDQAAQESSTQTEVSAEQSEQADPGQQGGQEEADAQEGTASAEESESTDTQEASDVAFQQVADRVQAMSRPSILHDYGDASYTAPEASYTQQEVEPGLTNVYNADQFYLDDQKIALLEQNGFYLRGGYEKEFFPTYEGNRYAMIPNFVTVDSMMHTYHLYFAYLMKTTEMSYLSGELSKLSALMQDKSAAQYEALTGTEWEEAAKTNLAFFAVANKLLDAEAETPAAVKDLVDQETALIEEANGIAPSPLLKIEEDYSQYIPRGYYESDPALVRYFKAMMWYGRRNFMQSDENQNRAALLMTLALDQDSLPVWESIYTITSFFAGASDDSGYYEYKPLIDAAYGENITVADLPGNPAWDDFNRLTAELEPPKINSVPVYMTDTDEEREEKILGYRFMGQRFTLDASIFAQLIYRQVKENPAGDTRMLPDALDVPAALGSEEALGLLTEQGAMDFANYPENMQKLRDMVAEADDSTWNASLYSGWLNTLRPVLEEKGEGYPDFMQGSAWNRKNLVTFLGSYTELKHDTILYAKQVMAEMGGGGELIEWDDRGYVEPEPEVYARLTSLVRATYSGLEHYGMISEEDIANMQILAELSDQLRVIAEKELKNEVLSDEEYDLIRSYGGQLEHFWQEVMKHEADNEYFTTKDFPSALVADIATDPNGYCLEVGTGKPAEIVVLVEVAGQLKLCSGVVYSFYEFPWPISDRLTDTAWREMMGIEPDENGNYQYEQAVDMPAWEEELYYKPE